MYSYAHTFSFNLKFFNSSSETLTLHVCICMYAHMLVDKKLLEYAIIAISVIPTPAYAHLPRYNATT